MVGKSNESGRDLDLDLGNLEDISVENLVREVARAGYGDVAGRLDVEEEDIHYMFRAAGIPLRPSAVKRAARFLEEGMALEEVKKKKLTGKYTDEDKIYIAKYYRKLKTLSETARYFNSSTDRIKQVCLKNGITKDEIYSNAENSHFDNQRIVVFYNANKSKTFETADIAAQYAIDHFHTKSKNPDKVKDSIRTSCKSDFKQAYGYKWCYEKDALLYKERITVHTDEPEERQALCGIYIIRNDLNNKVYVGKTTVSFKVRWNEHRKSVYDDSKSDRRLYEAMREIDFEHFTFHILEVLDNKDPDEFFLYKEKEWRDHFHALDPACGYNMKSSSPNEQTEREQMLLMLLELTQGKNRSDIAKEHGVSQSLVSVISSGQRNHIDSIDYPVKTPNDFLFEYKHQVLFRLLHDTSLSYEEISQILDLPLNAVVDFNRGAASTCESFAEYEYPIREDTRRSRSLSKKEKHRKKESLKLEEIQYIYESEELTELLAQKFNLSQDDVREIKQNPNRCHQCKTIITYKFEKCPKCALKERQKITADREILSDLIYNRSFKEIGEIYGTSDRAVAKRCREFGLPYTKKLIELGKTIGWDVFCGNFASNEELYLAMTVNNHRSKVSDEEVIDMYLKQGMCITKISQQTNKCVETIRSILRKNNIEISKNPGSKKTRCVELDIIQESTAAMGRFLLEHGYASNAKAESVTKHISLVLNNANKTYLGFHFETI